MEIHYYISTKSTFWTKLEKKRQFWAILADFCKFLALNWPQTFLFLLSLSFSGKTRSEWYVTCHIRSKYLHIYSVWSVDVPRDDRLHRPEHATAGDTLHKIKKRKIKKRKQKRKKKKKKKKKKERKKNERGLKKKKKKESNRRH